MTSPLLSVGIFLGVFSQGLVSAYPSHEIGTSSSRLMLPRLGINRSSKDNGFLERAAEYATHRPYKADFDLLRVSEPSEEVEMPLLRSNDLDGGRDPEYYLALDPTLRSRRKRQVSQQHQQQVIQPQSSAYPSNDIQRVNLCIPYFNTNPLCRQMFFGVPSNANSNVNVMGSPHSTSALAVPSSASSAIFIPSTFSPSSPSAVSSNVMPAQYLGALNRNDLAILNYYQQQFAPPQAPLQQQVGVFQGPLPDQRQRQRPEIPNIHTKYPYPYPPTLDLDPSAQAPAGSAPESVGPEEINSNADGGITTDYPYDASSGTTLAPNSNEQQQDPAAPSANIPDSSFQQQQPSDESSTVEANNPPPPPSSSSSQTPAPPPSSSSSAPRPPTPPPRPEESDAMANSPHQQHIEQLNSALKNQIREKEQLVREKEEEIRQIKSQLEQANLQVVSYEQENAVYREYKEQYMRSEEANVKLRDRVQQLENTNQHLQEQYGQLQQVSSEQKQQINSLKDTQQQLMAQVEDYQNQMIPLSKEVQRHRKEIEDFLIRIRKLGEENETCKKQVKLYQLKVSYIQEHQQPKQPGPPPPSQTQPKKHQQQASQQRPQSSSPAIVAHDDDELDPELMRMDAEIAALQKNAEELAVVIKNLPQPIQVVIAGDSSNVAVTAPEPVDLKKEGEFPGEAVQVNPVRTQQEQNPAVPAPDNSARAPSASRTMPTWEKPAGF